MFNLLVLLKLDIKEIDIRDDWLGTSTDRNKLASRFVMVMVIQFEHMLRAFVLFFQSH